MFDIDSTNTVILKDVGILLIQEFKVLWDSDKTKGKDTAMNIFAYIYFHNDFKSPYRKSYAKKDLPAILKKDLNFPSSWEPTVEILVAEKKYNELQTSKALKVLIAAEMALEQVTLYFEDFNQEDIKLEDRADAIKKLMDNLKSIDDVVGKLAAAREKVEKELESRKLAGTKTLSSRELPKSKRR